MSKRITTADQIEKLERKINYLVLIQEFNAIANMMNAHAMVANGMQDEANQMAMALRKLKEEGKENDELAQQIREDIQTSMQQTMIFKFLHKNESEAMDIISNKLLPLLQQKYPILQRKMPGEENLKAKCQVCGEPATVAKNGVYACRKHFQQVFQTELKKLDE